MQKIPGAAAPIAEGLFLSIREFGAIAGLSRPTIYKLVLKTEIHAIRIGRKWRIPKSEVQRLLNAKGAA